MSNSTLIIPVRLPPEHGFFISKEVPPPQTLFGFPARYRIENGYPYLEIQSVPADSLADVLERVRNCLKWAAVRLDMGMDTPQGPLQHAKGEGFDGQSATAYPCDLQPNIIRVKFQHRNEEPVNRLFAALKEGASKTKLASSGAERSLRTAAEFFTATDFEVTENSKYLMLCTVLEVLADPKARPTLCIYLVEELIENIKKAQKIAKQEADAETQEDLQGLLASIVHWKKESITSSIRKLARKTAQTLGDSDAEQRAKRASELYTKRNGLVHRGESVTATEVNELRTLVREALAVEAGCDHRIRDRFP
jgi:hypothetical protein